MATRSIVTSHPDVACDVCGRRLLRGEQPDVFLSGGQRRMVCELCVPRAAHEGWQREAEEPSLTLRPSGGRRTRSLLGRLRQTRWPIADRSPDEPSLNPDEPSLSPAGGPPIVAAGRDYGGLYDFLDSDPRGTRAVSGDEEPPALQSASSPEERQAVRALEVFNRSEHPRRVAGVARSLGEPAVRVALVADSESLVTLLVAWDLCWYRYQVDLHDEQAGALLQAQGMELEELPAQERVANAAANQRGELALLA